MADGERGCEVLEVEHERGGVDGHVEDGSGEREPCLLKPPEGTDRASHPGVEATFGRNCRGELAEHEGGGQAPEKRQEQKEQKSAAVPGKADHVLKAVRTAGDHEVGSRKEREQAQFARGWLVHRQSAAPLVGMSEGIAFGEPVRAIALCWLPCV